MIASWVMVGYIDRLINEERMMWWGRRRNDKERIIYIVRLSLNRRRSREGGGEEDDVHANCDHIKWINLRMNEQSRRGERDTSWIKV